MQESGDSVGFPGKLREVWPPFEHIGERGENTDRALALSKEHEPSTSPPARRGEDEQLWPVRPLAHVQLPGNVALVIL